LLGKRCTSSAEASFRDLPNAFLRHGTLIIYNPLFMLRFFTTGESHGEALVAVLSGIPAGLRVDREFVDRELWRRQQGYGRGGRMKIERDAARFVSGVRHANTIGSPITMLIENRDWDNWKEVLPVDAGDPAKHKAVNSPRPGHADLAGVLKYDFRDARYVLERASARETTGRVALGALAKLFLRELGVEVLSHVTAVGEARSTRPASWNEILELSTREEVLFSCADPEAERRMKAEVDRATEERDTLGGVFEVVAHGLVPGLGTYAQWDERLDAQLAAAVMSVQAVKAVEIGDGVASAFAPGSQVHDEIGYADVTPVPSPAGPDATSSAASTGVVRHTRFTRPTNRAGGIEGGITNGEDVVVRGYIKPISTLRRPLGSVDFATREPVKAAYERSDVCVVPAGGVVAESMVALVLARAALEKFGGDSMKETLRNFAGYCDQLRRY
jgi:chorismate synthase